MNTQSKLLKAPFPYFGGKSAIAAKVWKRFGDVKNYVEPFFGSGAVLLARPHSPRVETVNDANAWLTNFWRALQHDPAGVAAYADYPVSELDLHARGDFIYCNSDVDEFVAQLRGDPAFYDVKIAGWWVFYVCGSIAGGGFARRPELGGHGGGSGVHKLSLRVERSKPSLSNGGRGINRNIIKQVPRRRPELGKRGGGINRGALRVVRALPIVGKGGQRGIQRVKYMKPAMSKNGNGINALSVRDNLTAYLGELAARLRGVRICCGDWTRVVTPAVTLQHGETAVFLDPPYSQTERDATLYTVDAPGVAAAVRDWAIVQGDNPLFKIALCGYDTEHGDYMPENWACFRWRAHGGFGNQGNGRGRANRDRECIWFSPHCVKPHSAEQLDLWSV